MKSPKNPVPDTPDNFLYWIIAAVGGALVGGLVYSYLVRNDPLKL